MDLKKIRVVGFFVFGFLLSNTNSIFSQTLAEAIGQMEKLDYKKSIEILDRVIEKNPDFVIAFTYRGYAYMMTEKYDRALADYKKADSISSSADTLSGIQWALLALGQNDESIATGQKILAIDSKNYYAKQRIGDAYLEKKEYAKASENYKQLQEQNGKNADLLWKIGLCEYYKGNKDEATKLFQEGSKLSPEHKGIQYSLSGASSGYPYLAVIPEASSYGFKGSDYVGNGQKYGLGVSYSPNVDWNIRASAINDTTQNLNSTKGVTNYIIDPINIAYLSDYGYLKFPSYIPSYYFGSYTNLKNLATLITSQDYVTTKYAMGVSYKISNRFSVHFTPQGLKSNTALLNGGAAAQLGVSYTNKFTLSVSGAAISAPNSKGGQGTVTFYYPFLEKFYTSSTISGQYMSVNSTNIVFLAVGPILTTTDTVKNSKGYGFFQQEFGYASGNFYGGIGGRYGTARTPFMGENWIYTGFDMLYGGYGQVGVKTENLTVQLQYSHDKWLDSRNDRPTSDTVKLMLIWRL